MEHKVRWTCALDGRPQQIKKLDTMVLMRCIGALLIFFCVAFHQSFAQEQIEEFDEFSTPAIDLDLGVNQNAIVDALAKQIAESLSEVDLQSIFKEKTNVLDQMQSVVEALKAAAAGKVAPQLPQEQQAGQLSGGDGRRLQTITAPSFPHHYGLSSSCSNQLCEYLTTQLSCKGTYWGWKKVITFTPYVFDCWRLLTSYIFITVLCSLFHGPDLRLQRLPAGPLCSLRHSSFLYRPAQGVRRRFIEVSSGKHYSSHRSHQ